MSMFNTAIGAPASGTAPFQRTFDPAIGAPASGTAPFDDQFTSGSIVHATHIQF